MVFGHHRTSECENSRTMLSAHLDGRLAPTEEQSLQAHIATCQACAEDLQTLRLTVSALGQLPNVPVPRPFLLPARAPVQRGPSIWYSYLRNATGAVAALLVALLAFGYLAQSSLPFEVRGTTTKATAPANRLAAQSSSGTSNKALEREAETGDSGAQSSQDLSRLGPLRAAAAPTAAAEPPEITDASAGAPSAAAPLAKPAAPAAVPPAAAPAAARPRETAAPAAAPATGGSQFASPTQPPQTIEGRDQVEQSQATANPAEAIPTYWPLGELQWGLAAVLAALMVATMVARLRSS